MDRVAHTGSPAGAPGRGALVRAGRAGLAPHVSDVSHSILIDQRHRLRAADLAGKALPTVVRSIAYEGIEDMTPLVYFEGLGRPLALDFDQRGDFSRIARSTILADWVGLAVVLRPEKIEGGETIRVYGFDEEPQASIATSSKARRRVRRSPRPIVSVLLVLLIVALALVAASAVESMPNLLTFFGQ